MHVIVTAMDEDSLIRADKGALAGHHWVELSTRRDTITINVPPHQADAWREIAERINALSSAPAETSPAAPAEEAA